eukprot:1306469-Amphidinium_carterae.1
MLVAIVLGLVACRLSSHEALMRTSDAVVQNQADMLSPKLRDSVTTLVTSEKKILRTNTIQKFSNK